MIPDIRRGIIKSSLDFARGVGLDVGRRATRELASLLCTVLDQGGRRILHAVPLLAVAIDGLAGAVLLVTFDDGPQDLVDCGSGKPSRNYRPRPCEWRSRQSDTDASDTAGPCGGIVQRLVVLGVLLAARFLDLVGPASSDGALDLSCCPRDSANRFLEIF